MAYWPFFLVPLIPAATTIFLSLLANYLVRRAKWLESMRILRALTTHGREDTWARAWYGLRERGCWGGFLRLIRGIAGFISGLAGVTVVVLLLVDMCITAYDGTTPLPSPSSKMVTVSPPSSPSSVKVHLACVEPGNATENIGRFPYRRHDLPTILYEAPSGVPGSLAILNPAVSLNNDDIPGRWIFEMQEKGEVGRVCIWDRPGYGFSEVLPRADLGDVVDALWLALEQAEVTKNIKFVLVGEGYGGLLTRVFASRHPSSIHSYLHLEAQTSLTYFSPPRGDFAGPKLLLHRLSTRVLPSILTPLSITRLPSLLLRRSTSISRILASTYTQTSQLNGNLRKALLQETFSSHTHQSASFAALLHSADSYPIRPAVVLSSAERMKDLKWAEGQEALAREGQGKGICKEALRTLYAS
ncbi:hypothetical protein M231_00818 [Tremella mesenterica]|uniref:AB hydrolase-1 domain-containing protein n=1 Tax=Tremella mesenterica TaxID=5217 RepID=A0A4Q1BUL9_TREME|nr:hypothetical protein M231_00818 [Tremella mesenterica]